MTQRVARVDDLGGLPRLLLNDGLGTMDQHSVWWDSYLGVLDRYAMVKTTCKSFFLWQPKHQLSVIMELCTCGHLCMGYFSARSV